MTEEKKFAGRLIELREQRGITAVEMSLSIEQSKSYINKIERCHSMPSMKTFFDICDFLNVTPKEFFDYDTEDPNLSNELLEELRKLDYMETQNVLALVKAINKKYK